MILPWFVVLIYIVAIIATVVSMKRRIGQVWNWGNSFRSLFPDDRLYRKIREWDTRFHAWKKTVRTTHELSLQSLNLLAGKLEYFIGHLRDYTIGLYMMARFVFDLTLMVFGEPALRAERFPSFFYHGFFALLTLWTYRCHVTTGLKMTEFMRVNPTAHPQEFFDHYYRRLGPAAVPGSAHPARGRDHGAGDVRAAGDRP